LIVLEPLPKLKSKPRDTFLAELTGDMTVADEVLEHLPFGPRSAPCTVAARPRRGDVSGTPVARTLTDPPIAQTGSNACASLDELLELIKSELTKLGPTLDPEVVREPQGSRTEVA
jgi:hypothetical protein